MGGLEVDINGFRFMFREEGIGGCRGMWIPSILVISKIILRNNFKCEKIY